ncbi:MAG: type II secretion system GspH family protein [Zoogloeaceae bacterium]|jgi:prepilin-type N-terminal cleavage/methylation domain-containing protein|nr:type II secretion system GspH family protein [Zoogloeaceae bacterium]
MLNKLKAMSAGRLKAALQSVDVSAVKGRALKRRFESIRGRKQGGFTLLELLVVVAILAAIAGTATIMLQDTDRKAAAAAHVAMMDELSKGIQTFVVLNKGKYPDVWDSLLVVPGTDLPADLSAAKPLALLSAGDLVGDPVETAVGPLATDWAAASGYEGSIGTATIPLAGIKSLVEAGITQVRLIGEGNVDADAWGATLNCTNNAVPSKKGGTGIRALVENVGNDVTPQNIFRKVDANGCGLEKAFSFINTSGADVGEVTDDLETAGLKAFIWTGALERVGVPTEVASETPPVLVAFGVGPDSTLFDPSIIGALSNVPVYRHVENWQYNRFLVLFNVGSVTPAAAASYTFTNLSSNGKATFQAIIDGAGDTKDEELGEVDNIRAT